MNSATEQRRSQRSKGQAQRRDASKEPPQASTSKRPMPQKQPPLRRPASKRGSMLEDIQAASVPVSHYEAIETKYSEDFYEGDSGRVPLYKPTMEELEDPAKLIKHGVAMALEADTAFVKVRMPSEWVQRLRATDDYPYYYPLMLSAVRETIREFDKNGPAGAYVRETEHYDKYLPREFTFPQEILKVPKKERPKKILDSFFDPELQSWRDCEKNFWQDIPKTFNHNVLYAPEIDGSLFAKSFGPFNLNGMIGCLKDAFKSQGNIPGIFTSVVYFGRSRSSFPWHVEDFELLSLNYHHLGAPKLWYGLAPSEADKCHATFCQLYRRLFDKCPQEHRHKRLFALPELLEQHHLKVVKTVQQPGDLLITAPFGYHMGFSFGPCVTEAVNHADKDINPKIIEKVHDEDLFCQCGYMVTGVILDYQVYSVNGHMHTIAKQREQIANMSLRIAELERGHLFSAPASPFDGRVPSTSAAAREYQQGEPYADFESHDSGHSDYTSTISSHGTDRPSRSVNVKRRRMNMMDSDEDSDDDRPSATHRYKSKFVEEDEDSNEDDGRVRQLLRRLASADGTRLRRKKKTRS